MKSIIFSRIVVIVVLVYWFWAGVSYIQKNKKNELVKVPTREYYLNGNLWHVIGEYK